MNPEEPSLLVLSSSEFALVDTDLLPELSRFKWSRIGGKIRYVARGLTKADGRKGIEYLHRRVNRTAPRSRTDHGDLNVLNNTRLNLRTATASENGGNAPKTSSPTSSRFKGVLRNAILGKWQAWITVERRHKYLGVFSTEIDAAAAYNRAATEHFGQFARPNDIQLEQH